METIISLTIFTVPFLLLVSAPIVVILLLADVLLAVMEAAVENKKIKQLFNV